MTSSAVRARLAFAAAALVVLLIEFSHLAWYRPAGPLQVHIGRTAWAAGTLWRQSLILSLAGLTLALACLMTSRTLPRVSAAGAILTAVGAAIWIQQWWLIEHPDLPSQTEYAYVATDDSTSEASATVYDETPQIDGQPALAYNAGLTWVPFATFGGLVVAVGLATTVHRRHRARPVPVSTTPPG